jgi:hypothetical protein
LLYDQVDQFMLHKSSGSPDRQAQFARDLAPSVIADFARIQILFVVFDGDPDRWLESIEQSGTETDQADIPFLLDMKRRLEDEPSLSEELRGLVRRFAETFARSGTTNRRSESPIEMDRLITAMLPQSAIPSPPQVLQARRNAVARDALFREFGALTSTDIGELAGTKATNRAALAHRWKADGRIFSVPHQSGNVFPGFQFSGEGQPLPAIADVIEILGDRFAAWELALWFTTPNGWLGGRRPVDLLERDPDRVSAAANHAAEALVF